MTSNRKLRLRTERLEELTTEELVAVVAGQQANQTIVTVTGLECVITLRACLTGTETYTCPSLAVHG